MDFWDHKPPLVFYLNALGLWLGGGSAWGVWLLEGLALAAAGWLLYRAMRPALGGPASAAGLLLLALGLYLLFQRDETNVPETWGILLQALIALLAARYGQRKRLRWLFFAGVAAGLLFLLKQVLVGAALALAVLLAMDPLRARRSAGGWRALAAFALGAAAALLAALGLLAWQGALGAFWDAAFRFSAFYMRATGAAWLRALGENLLNPLWPAALAGYAGWALALRRWRREGGLPWIVRFAVIALPLEIAFSALSGRNFLYYSNARLYALAILGAYLFGQAFTRLAAPSRIARSAAVSGLAALSLLAVVLFSALPGHIALRPSRNRYVLAVEYIASRTRAGETVLLWGHDPAILFYAGRESPSRFIYQYPLFTPGYADETKAAEFARSLQTHPPALIVDTRSEQLPPLDANPPEGPMRKALAAIREGYTLSDSLSGWDVYTPNR